jgi:hypothetical protein
MLKWPTCSKKGNEPSNKKQQVFAPKPKNDGAVTSPQSFQAAFCMQLTAWKTMHGDIVKLLPTELIEFFPTDKSPLVTGKHNHFQQAKSDSTPI